MQSLSHKVVLTRGVDDHGDGKNGERKQICDHKGT